MFTDTPLAGNPVAVFADGAELEPDLMQRTARELNLSETVFLGRGEDGCDASIRIFTPAVELPFAGHPTLGAAFVVGERDGLEVLQLRTGVGPVRVELARDGDQLTYGEMEQPLPRRVEFAGTQELLRALGVDRSELPIEAYSNGPVHVYVALASSEAVAALAPDHRALERLGTLNVSCFACTGKGQVHTRMFAPGLGISEDPATGSAAGPLALHLALSGQIAFGQRIEIRQGAEIGRPSLLRARVEGGVDAIERVLVGGAAVQVASGSYRLK